MDAAAHTAEGIEHVDVIDLGAVKLSVTGTRPARRRRANPSAGRADLRQIPVDQSRRILALAGPGILAEGGREWALENLGGGTVDVGGGIRAVEAHRATSYRTSPSISTVSWRCSIIRGLEVQLYMPHMPELETVSGKARYENGTLHFDVAGGTAVGLGKSPEPPST